MKTAKVVNVTGNTVLINDEDGFCIPIEHSMRAYATLEDVYHDRITGATRSGFRGSSKLFFRTAKIAKLSVPDPESGVIYLATPIVALCASLLGRVDVAFPDQSDCYRVNGEIARYHSLVLVVGGSGD